jgi:integrase
LSIDRTGGVGKRDYAMILLAAMLGMRAGDICCLKFENLDWNLKLITYTQQKTNKVNVLPILPAVGDAIIDYLKHGRIETESKNVFVRHINPYGEFQSSTALSENLKRYMGRAGLVVEDRKAAHSLRHTLANCLLSDRTPPLVISGALGHDNPITTLGYYDKKNVMESNLDGDSGKYLRRQESFT